MAGNVGWIQIGTSDPNDVQRFYAELFGWTFQSAPGTDGAYRVIQNAGAPIGGIHDHRGDRGDYAIFCIVVDDVADVLTRAEKAGGKVLQGPDTAADGLVSAQLIDVVGNEFAIFSPPPR
jgi:predicted enzyme related to lactoylglutathione lyase